MAKPLTVASGTDIPPVLFREEQEYERQLTELVGEVLDNMVTIDLVSIKAVNLSKVVLDRPFDSIWFIRLH